MKTARNTFEIEKSVFDEACKCYEKGTIMTLTFKNKPIQIRLMASYSENVMYHVSLIVGVCRYKSRLTFVEFKNQLERDAYGYYGYEHSYKVRLRPIDI